MLVRDHRMVPVTLPATALAGLPPLLFAFDNFELDEVRFELRASGEAVPMEPQVFDLLRYMVRNDDRVLTKDELLDAIWPERYVTEATLNSRVMSARKALGDDGRQQRYIKTVHGRGYRFVAPVAMAGKTAPPLAVSTVLVAPGPSWYSSVPVASTTFVGRQTELARIKELLIAEGPALVSIVGPGGIGKTRLAVAAASRAQATGLSVVYVPLEPVLDATHLPGAIAGAIGLKPSTADTAAEVVRHLAGARLLLVLDNFEQIAERGAPFVSALMASAPGVRVLVTSRVVLGLVEEWVFRLEGLAVGEDGCGEAVDLFLERARQSNAAAPAPSEEECRTVEQIVRLVDGMPLAIELAASLTPYLPFAEIAALLAQDSGVLTSDQQNAIPRHRNMRALLDESCRHIDPAQHRAMRSLSVFDGPFGALAAAQVAGASLPLLRQLVDRSMIQAVDGRFTVHPLMRQFARECCGPELEELRRRQAEYYASFLAARHDALNGRGQVGATYDIESEFTNIAASWRWAASQGRIDLIDAAMYPLFCHLTFRARFFDSDELASIAIQAVEWAGDAHHDTLGALLMHHFWVLSRLGRGRDTLATLARVKQLFADGHTPRPGIGMDPRTAVAVVQLGAGNYRGSAETALEALESARVREDPSATAFAAWLAGHGRLRQARLELAGLENGRLGYRPLSGDDHDTLEDADRLNRVAARILEAAGETWLRAHIEIERGLLRECFGDRPGAEQHFRTAAELRRSIGDPQGTASALIYLADLLLDEEHLEECATIHAEASALFARTGDASGLTESERFAGRMALVRGDFEAAAARFSRTLEMSAAIGFSNNVLSSLRGMARILKLTGRLEPAAIVHAFVAAHPAPTPFSRATSEFDLAEIGRELGGDVVPFAREQAAAMDIDSVSSLAFAAMKEPPAGTPGSDRSRPLPRVKLRDRGLVV